MSLPLPCIELYAIFERDGTFGKTRCKRWGARAYGVNGAYGVVPGAEWTNADKQWPERAAREYAEFTGWPVFEIDEVGDRQPEKVR